MKENLEKILQGDLEEARINEICSMIQKELEWLRRRLQGHSFQTGAKEHIVSMDYVNARIDDMEEYL